MPEKPRLTQPTWTHTIGSPTCEANKCDMYLEYSFTCPVILVKHRGRSDDLIQLPVGLKNSVGNILGKNWAMSSKVVEKKMFESTTLGHCRLNETQHVFQHVTVLDDLSKFHLPFQTASLCSPSGTRDTTFQTMTAVGHPIAILKMTRCEWQDESWQDVRQPPLDLGWKKRCRATN